MDEKGRMGWSSLEKAIQQTVQMKKAASVETIFSNMQLST